MRTVKAWAAPSATEPLTATTIERRDVGPNDVLIEIAYAGICHSDIHTARAEWGDVPYPIVVGHEIAGTVAAVGAVAQVALAFRDYPANAIPSTVVLDAQGRVAAVYVAVVPEDDLRRALDRLMAEGTQR